MGPRLANCPSHSAWSLLPLELQRRVLGIGDVRRADDLGLTVFFKQLLYPGPENISEFDVQVHHAAGATLYPTVANHEAVAAECY